MANIWKPLIKLLIEYNNFKVNMILDITESVRICDNLQGESI